MIPAERALSPGSSGGAELHRPGGFSAIPGVEAAFTTRRGGVSEGPYRSLNLGLSTEDEPRRVRTNRRRVLDRMGFEPDQLAVAGQVHGADVLRVEEPGLYPGYDGLVTDRPDCVLAISAADCAAVLLAEETGRRVGACHAGWRGTLGGVIGAAVDALKELGARTSRLDAYVSPCIGLEQFEVGPEVASRFASRYVHRRADWERPHVDLKACIRDQLIRNGLDEARIEIDPQCTVSEADQYFSYRAHGETTGRMMGLIGRHSDA